jgi:hypothetical protein
MTSLFIFALAVGFAAGRMTAPGERARGNECVREIRRMLPRMSVEQIAVVEAICKIRAGADSETRDRSSS